MTSAVWHGRPSSRPPRCTSSPPAIYDDRKKVSPGVKFKDAELIGVPLIAVAGRDTVNNGTIEIRNRDSSDSVAVPVADAAQTLASRLDTLLGK